MTATSEPATATAGHGPADDSATPDPAQCGRCGAPLVPDQEWCLECGTARTVVHRPPDWRIPAAIIGAVALLVLAGFAIALVNTSSQANRDVTNVTVTNPPDTTGVPTPSTTAARTTATTATSTTAAGKATTGPPATTAQIPHWPTGQTGWTVGLFTGPTAPVARARARVLIGEGVHAGVLFSSRHPAMAPGQWIVFAGRYPSQGAALDAAARLRARGFPAAASVLVAPAPA